MIKSHKTIAINLMIQFALHAGKKSLLHGKPLETQVFKAHPYKLRITPCATFNVNRKILPFIRHLRILRVYVAHQSVDNTANYRFRRDCKGGGT